MSKITVYIHLNLNGIVTENAVTVDDTIPIIDWLRIFIEDLHPELQIAPEQRILISRASPELQDSWSPLESQITANTLFDLDPDFNSEFVHPLLWIYAPDLLIPKDYLSLNPGLSTNIKESLDTMSYLHLSQLIENLKSTINAILSLSDLPHDFWVRITDTYETLHNLPLNQDTIDYPTILSFIQGSITALINGLMEQSFPQQLHELTNEYVAQLRNILPEYDTLIAITIKNELTFDPDFIVNEYFFCFSSTILYWIEKFRPADSKPITEKYGNLHDTLHSTLVMLCTHGGYIDFFRGLLPRDVDPDKISQIQEIIASGINCYQYVVLANINQTLQLKDGDLVLYLAHCVSFYITFFTLMQKSRLSIPNIIEAIYQTLSLFTQYLSNQPDESTLRNIVKDTFESQWQSLRLPTNGNFLIVPLTKYGNTGVFSLIRPKIKYGFFSRNIGAPPPAPPAMHGHPDDFYDRAPKAPTP